MDEHTPMEIITTGDTEMVREHCDIPIHSRAPVSLVSRMRKWMRINIRSEAGLIRDALRFYLDHLDREELSRDREFADRD